MRSQSGKLEITAGCEISVEKDNVGWKHVWLLAKFTHFGR